MIAHVVLLAPRAELTREQRASIASAFERAAREIPSVRRVRVGRRLRTGGAYESAMTADFAYVAIFEFDDVAGLQAYLEHPAHAELGARFYDSVTAGLAYDYEFADVEAAREWLQDVD